MPELRITGRRLPPVVRETRIVAWSFRTRIGSSQAKIAS